MSIPLSRTELAEYCLRQLGAPVLEINIDEDQIEDRIDEAIQFYQEYHADAVVRTFIKYEVTQEDIEDKIIELPDAVLSVVKILNIIDSEAGGMFNVKYQMFLNDVHGLRSGQGLINYAMTKDYLGMIEHLITGNSQQVTYSRHQNTLHILTDWTEHLKPGDYLIIECYTGVNPETYPEVYNDMALKRYLTAILKRQWGNNLKKFEGMQLPGGVTINGAQIYQEAVDEIREMEEQWEGKYGQPVDFYMG